MFGMRLLSGIILLLGTFLILSCGGDVLCAFALALALIGMYELYRVKSIEKSILGAVGYVAACVYFLLLRSTMEEYAIILFVFVFMFLMGVLVFAFPRYTVENVMFAFAGVFYVAVMMSYLYKARMAENGNYFVWLIFVGAWGCDTCAYCVGKLFGKHKLAPILSPKKSVEGSIGGIVGALLLGLLFAEAVKQKVAVDVDVRIFCILTSLAVAVVSQIGDLTASAIKRTYGIKDYGTLIPGHGGILDRFDSVLFSAPVVYFAMIILLKK